MKKNIRASAALVIYQIVVKKRSLSDVLTDYSKEFSDARDRALLQAICYGVCRWYFRLDFILQTLLEKPMKQKDQDIYALLLVGLYQLFDMRLPEYAVVNETVAATKSLKKIWAKNLVNGVLREYQRRAESFTQNLTPEAFYSHPVWIIEKLKQNYKEEKAILDANNQYPPFALRVNQQKINRENYLNKLMKSGITAEIIPETQSGIVLTQPIDVNELPGFAAGEVSVQDGAAQLAAELIMLEPQQKILDACAAPGGKTAHMLELQPTIECIAIDKDISRLVSLKENLKRLQLKTICIAADAADTAKWWDGILFDRILLDAPCSASGVIRRHPDIKILRRASDIPRLAETQLRLLTALWPLLKPQGILLYATCSIFPEENSQVLQQFLHSHPEAQEVKITSSWGIDCSIGKQILPGMHGMDGFYFARLRK